MINRNTNELNLYYQKYNNMHQTDINPQNLNFKKHPINRTEIINQKNLNISNNIFPKKIYKNNLTYNDNLKHKARPMSSNLYININNDEPLNKNKMKYNNAESSSFYSTMNQNIMKGVNNKITKPFEDEEERIKTIKKKQQYNQVLQEQILEKKRKKELEKQRQIEEELKLEMKIKQELEEKIKREELEKQRELIPMKNKINNIEYYNYNQEKSQNIFSNQNNQNLINNYNLQNNNNNNRIYIPPNQNYNNNFRNTQKYQLNQNYNNNFQNNQIDYNQFNQNQNYNNQFNQNQNYSNQFNQNQNYSNQFNNQDCNQQEKNIELLFTNYVNECENLMNQYENNIENYNQNNFNKNNHNDTVQALINERNIMSEKLKNNHHNFQNQFGNSNLLIMNYNEKFNKYLNLILDRKIKEIEDSYKNENIKNIPNEQNNNINYNNNNNFIQNNVSPFRLNDIKKCFTSNLGNAKLINMKKK